MNEMTLRILVVNLLKTEFGKVIEKFMKRRSKQKEPATWMDLVLG
jgi:hypothetical protein